MKVEPSASKTEIRFVSGFESNFRKPKRAKDFGARLAVIQESYRPDSDDMFFDEALWLRLLAFAQQFAPRCMAVILAEYGGAESSVDQFLADWTNLAPEDRKPSAIIVRDERAQPILYIEPEYWTAVGGPMPYHDSYTYSIYSHDDLSARVRRFLCDAEAAKGWKLATRVLQPGETGIEAADGT